MTSIPPRLLTMQQAAQYCGMGYTRFFHLFPSMGINRVFGKMIDIRDLDKAIEKEKRKNEASI